MNLTPASLKTPRRKVFKHCRHRHSPTSSSLFLPLASLRLCVSPSSARVSARDHQQPSHDRMNGYAASGAFRPNRRIIKTRRESC